VFLRPVVLRDGAAATPIAAERYRRTIEEQKKAKPAPHPVLPEVESPVLPPLPGDE
jgi:general secretion pathway protein D